MMKYGAKMNKYINIVKWIIVLFVVYWNEALITAMFGENLFQGFFCVCVSILKYD